MKLFGVISELDLIKAKRLRVLTEHDHLALADLGVEPGRVLGGDLAAVGAGRGQRHLVQQHAVDVGLPHLQGGHT